MVSVTTRTRATPNSRLPLLATSHTDEEAVLTYGPAAEATKKIPTAYYQYVRVLRLPVQGLLRSCLVKI